LQENKKTLYRVKAKLLTGMRVLECGAPHGIFIGAPEAHQVGKVVGWSFAGHECSTNEINYCGLVLQLRNSPGWYLGSSRTGSPEPGSGDPLAVVIGKVYWENKQMPFEKLPTEKECREC
jgi:hypothetical protein